MSDNREEMTPTEVLYEDAFEKNLIRMDKMRSKRTSRHTRKTITQSEFLKLCGKVVNFSMTQNMTLDEIKQLPFSEAKAKLQALYDNNSTNSICGILKTNSYQIGKALKHYKIDRKLQPSPNLKDLAKPKDEPKPNTTSSFFRGSGLKVDKLLTALGQSLDEDKEYQLDILIKEV